MICNTIAELDAGAGYLWWSCDWDRVLQEGRLFVNVIGFFVTSNHLHWSGLFDIVFQLSWSINGGQGLLKKWLYYITTFAATGIEQVNKRYGQDQK